MMCIDDPKPNYRMYLAITLIIGILAGFTVGILIGAFAIEDELPDPVPAYEKLTREADPSIRAKLIDVMDASKIRENSKYLTSNPHVAGSKFSKEQAEWMKKKWIEWGMTNVELVAYDVLLSFPSNKSGEENRIEILYANDTVAFTTQLKENSLGDPQLERDDLLPPFNAYSPAGIVMGDLVYVNYGRVEDFFYLARNLSINVTDMIVIARYGKIYRGDKVHNAAQAGAKGMILYSDPADYAVPDAEVYPNGIYLPGTGAQRGTTYLGSGDPLTQGYPAKDYAFRPTKESIASELPAIPVHPIGYDDAKELLLLLGGQEVKDDWKGNLTGLTYRYGGSEFGTSNKTVRMQIFSYLQRTIAYNTIGMIEGEIEPDRYVILGNHRDAWAFGAIDASSGTSVLMEVARAFCKMLESDWRPRRTLVFGSWGAEEYGLIGSTEWVEEFSKNLGERTVAYLNLDVAVDGTYVLEAKATPNMKKIIYETTQLVGVPNPGENRKTVYDTWLARSSKDEDKLPHVGGLGFGSDYASFLQLGISAFDMTYTYDTVKYPVASYPLYHSVYETFVLVDEYLDPGFKYHLTTGHIVGELMRALSDSLVIPMSCVDYASDVSMYFEKLRDGEIGQQMIQNNITFDAFADAVKNFTIAADDFEARVAKVDKTNPIEIRMFNDQIMQLERSFIDPLGLPGRPLTRHIVFAPSSKNSYASEKFPGIVDAMFDIDNNPDPDKWDAVRQQLSIATFTVQSAASTLLPYTTSMS